jgi:hypothetical protein
MEKRLGIWNRQDAKDANFWRSAEEGMALLTLDMDRRPRGMEVLRGMKSLKQIHHHEVEVFWEAYDAGRFDQIQLPTWMLGWK